MRRTQQVAAVLKKELAPLIDEVLGGKFGIVTLVDIYVSPDIKEAKAYISCFDEKFEKPMFKVLEGKAGLFQHLLGKRLKMKFTPKITFLLDRSLENVIKVEQLFNEMDKK